VELGVFRSDLHKAVAIGSDQPREAWLVSPRATLGYQFGYGGAVLATYQYLGDSARADTDLSAFQPGAVVSSRAAIDLHWLDLDYRTAEYAPTPWWRLHGQAGGRLLFQDYDFRSEEAIFRYRDQATDHFFAGGPHLGLDNAFLPGDSGLALFGRADVGFLFGEHWFKYGSDYGDSGWHNTSHHSENDLELRLEGGVNWTASCLGRWLRLSTGYQYQERFYLAPLHGGDPFSLFRSHGPFARCELSF
jgi:hypothetical protein